MRRSLLPLASAVLLAAAASGRSQDPDPPGPPKPVFYDTATVVARPVSSSSGAVTVIDASEIEAAVARSVGDLLRTTPGLNALSSGGRAGLTHVGIRGGDPNFTLVLLDGIPLNDTTDPQGGAVNFEELPARLVERVEVVRGPLCSFYGASGLAGVVQLFTPRGGPGPVRTGLEAEAGSASLLSGAASISGPAGGGGYAAGASWERERGRVGEDRFRQLDARAGARLAFGPQGELRLTSRLSSGDTDDYPEASGGPLYGSGRLRASEHLDLALGAELEIGPSGGRRHRVFLGFSGRDLDRTSPEVPPLVPASTEDTRFRRLRLAWQAPLRRSARTHLALGVSGEGEWARNASVLSLPPFLGGDVPGDYEESRASGGGYLELARKQGPLLFEGGLRVDAASTDPVQVNPRLGVVYRPGRGSTRLRASLGRASKLPSFFALASPPALGGNPGLRPERTIGGEAGVDHSFGTRLEAGAAVFRHDYRDLVDFDFEAFTHVNRARVRAQGAELHLIWRPARVLTLQAEATWLDGRDLSGDPLLHRPRWVGGGHLTWRPAPLLTLRVTGRGVSRYLDRQLPVEERDSVAGYGLLGVSGSWRWRERWTLRARLDNLTGRAYETFIGFPGPGRSIRIGLAWDRP